MMIVLVLLMFRTPGSDVFVGQPDTPFKVPMEEYFTDNLLPVAEGEESKTSSSQPLLSTGHGLHGSKRLKALHQLHNIKKSEQVYPDSLEFMRYCLHAEVNNPEYEPERLSAYS